MTPQERRGWFMVVSLFVALLLVFGGGYNTLPVFLPALLRAFPSWSHQRVSILASVLAASAGVSVVPVGWLIDRIEARLVMVAGALAVGAAFLIASQADALVPLIVAYLLVGLGIAAGTVLPASLVIANWFTARRGIAMGFANSGSTTGGMVMTLAAGFFIRHWGWRVAYLLIGLPMIAIAAPLVVIAVRSRPPGSVRLPVARSAETLPGYEVRPALGTRSFWMIVLANFCFAFAATGTAIHMVAHLEHVGYSAADAAFAMSMIFGFAAIGKVLMGLLADRLTARRALAIDFAIQAAGISLAFAVQNTIVAPIFVAVYGLTVAAPLMLLPLLTAESLGLKRFGLIAGLAGLAQAFGAAIGPLVSGRIFDLTNSYASAFELFVAISVLGAISALGCRPYPEAGAPPVAIMTPASA